MEFLKEFVEEENVKLIKAFFESKKEYIEETEKEKEFEKELVKRIQENNKFLFINEKSRKRVI